MIVYDFASCDVFVDDQARYLVTRYPDGATVPARPNGDAASRRRAAELGYRTTWHMSRDHELAHHWLAEQADDGPIAALRAGLTARPSLTLWLVAHDEPTDRDDVRAEEARVLEWQRRLDKSTHARPWDDLKITVPAIELHPNPKEPTMTTTNPTTAIEAPAPTVGPLIPANVTGRPYRLEAVSDLVPGHHILIGRPAVEAVVDSTTKTATGWQIATTKDGAVGGRRAIRTLELEDGQAHADVKVARLADADDLEAIRAALASELDPVTDERTTIGAAHWIGKRLDILIETTLGTWTLSI